MARYWDNAFLWHLNRTMGNVVIVLQAKNHGLRSNPEDAIITIMPSNRLIGPLGG